MIDPLTEVVSLLQPQPLFSKAVSGAGSWRIQRTQPGQPYYCLVVEGASCLVAEEQEPIVLREGDFVLIPSAHRFAMSSLDAVTAHDFETAPVVLPNGEFRHGSQSEPADVRLLVGNCVFGSPDTALLVSLLPRLVHIHGDKRLGMIVQLVLDESRARRPAREVILARLLEVLLIEAVRFTAGNPDTPGLVCALADERLAIAIRRMHEQPAAPWSVEQLAHEAALSRTTFYERFRRAMGIAPMEYLFALRMALAKSLLRRDEGDTIAAIAESVGYGSASAFSVAFTRHVGVSPARYARRQREAPPAQEAAHGTESQAHEIQCESAT